MRDRLCGDLRHWLLNGKNLRHFCSSFHHLRRDPRHGNVDLFDILGHACSVIHAVAQLLFPLAQKDFNHESGFLKALSIARLLLAIKLELGVLLEVHNTLVQFVTAAHSTSGARARLCDVDGAPVDHGSATMAPLPCGTSASRETVGLDVSRVAVVLWSRCSEVPTASLANQARV